MGKIIERRNIGSTKTAWRKRGNKRRFKEKDDDERKFEY
jgi:hypothetical protein